MVTIGDEKARGPENGGANAVHPIKVSASGVPAHADVEAKADAFAHSGGYQPAREFEVPDVRGVWLATPLKLQRQVRTPRFHLFFEMARPDTGRGAEDLRLCVARFQPRKFCHDLTCMLSQSGRGCL
ncbi:MAG: hypothetical protein WCC66_08100, partial [Rhizobiaceae bacterium]